MSAPAPYVLLRQDVHPDGWLLVAIETPLLHELRLGVPVRGGPTAPTGPTRVVISAWGQRPSDLLDGPCPVVSSALRDALDGAGVDNVEYFPAHLYTNADPEPAVATDYWLANVVGAVACTAPLAGPLPPEVPGRPRVAAPFRILPERAGGLPCFRLAEDRELVAVDGRTAAAVRASGVRGVFLQPPEQYDGLPASTAPPDVEPSP